MNLTAVLSQPSDIESHTINQALTDPKWRQTTNDEFDTLVRNGTWELVPSNSMQNLVGCVVNMSFACLSQKKKQFFERDTQ
ncbi:hypothetical protein AAG906_028046 [Vitis piasezkii]